MSGSDPRGELLSLLDDARRSGRSIAFWWRDDDAETVTPDLERLLALAVRHALPLGLAVIPKGATEALSERLAGKPRIAVLQHGWQHALNSPPGEKKAEFGDHRPAADMLVELAAGRERLAALFGQNLLPVLVPPWNRIGATADAARREIGLAGLSLYGTKRTADPHLVNTHLDIFEWKTTRGPMSRDRACQILCEEVARRLAGSDEPIGILSHHLKHEEESWALLDELFGLLRGHPAARWPAIPDLFALPQSLNSRGTSGTTRRNE
jgi:hypothetical protein